MLRPIAEVNALGEVVARYVYGGNFAPDYVILADGSVLKTICDQLGSTRLVVELSSGAVVERYEFDDYGRALRAIAGGVAAHGFAGGLVDTDAGTIHWGARDYLPELGRWAVRDPIFFAGRDTNLYSYVENDPVNFVDPWGLMKLPPSPDGLGPDWTPDPTHRDPNGQRFRHPSGEYLDFHPRQPSKPGWRGRDHWHDSRDPKKHHQPGDDVPDFENVCQEPLESSGSNLDEDEGNKNESKDLVDELLEQMYPNGVPIIIFPIVPVPWVPLPTPVPLPVPA